MSNSFVIFIYLKFVYKHTHIMYDVIIARLLLLLLGATVVSLETDNVEKWAAEKFNFDVLGMKMFNKEGFKYNWWRNALDYR